VIETLGAALTATTCTSTGQRLKFFESFVEFSVAVASLITTQIENVTLREQTFCRYDLQHSYFEFLFDPCCNLYLWVG